MTLSPTILPPQRWFPVMDLPEKLQRAALATQQKIQSPLSMVITLAIGVMSEAVQGVAGVQIPHGPYCQLSNWVLVNAETGMGKTPSLEMLREPITAFERVQHSLYSVAMANYSAEHLGWDLEMVEYERAVRQDARKGVDTSASKKRLALHMALEPKLPRCCVLTYQDATPEAFCQGLCDNWPNAGLVSDEAASYLNGPMGRAMPMLNQRWESQPLSIERVSRDKPVFVQDPRVTLIWATQPGPFLRFMERRGQEARELGTLARFLPCQPDNNQGMRNVQPVETDQQAMAGFYDRVTTCLQASIDENGEPLSEKKVITFSPQAEARYHLFRSNIENALQPGGSLVNVKDFAAKAPRHLARLAGVFEFFETGNTVISLNMLERALVVMEWYIWEYVRIFTPPLAIPQEQLDADRLLPWLQQFTYKRHNRYLVLNDVRKHVLNELRDKERLERALSVLQQRGLIGRYIMGKIAYIDMAPLYMYDPAALSLALQAYRSARAK